MSWNLRAINTSPPCITVILHNIVYGDIPTEKGVKNQNVRKHQTTKKNFAALFYFRGVNAPDIYIVDNQQGVNNFLRNEILRC